MPFSEKNPNKSNTTTQQQNSLSYTYWNVNVIIEKGEIKQAYQERLKDFI